MGELLTAIEKHLTDLGYTVQIEENIVKASHAERYINFWVIQIGLGALFRTLFKLLRPADSDSAEFLTVVNRANIDATVSRFSAREGFLAVEAWYPPPYEHDVFEVFFNRYVFEISDWAGKNAEAVNKFFPGGESDTARESN